MICHSCAHEKDYCRDCELLYCECHGCFCVRRTVFNAPKKENPYTAPELRQVCLKCGFRKSSPHALACPFCFPQAMVYEQAWMVDLQKGVVTREIPPIRNDQLHSFKPFSEVSEEPLAPPVKSKDSGDVSQLSLWGNVA